MAKYDHLKETLYNFYKNNSHLVRKAIQDRFIELGAPERNLNHWLVKLLQNKKLDRKKASGRIAKKATSTVRKAIKRIFNHKSGRP